MPRRRKSNTEQEDDLREASRIERASYWLAHALTVAIQAGADPSDDRGDFIMKRRIERWKHDIQDTLALSLEAYALAMSGQDAARADALVADLEIGPKGLRMRRHAHYYHDLLEIRRIGRTYDRDQEKRRTKIAELEKLVTRSKEQEQELKQLRASVKRWEEDGY